MEKLTNKKALEFVLGLKEVKENTEVNEKLTKMLEQVEKKNGSGSKGKPSKTQLENENVKLEVLAELEKTGLTQIKELDLVKSGKYSGQKISALASQLLKEGKIQKVVEKRVAYFKIA